MKNQILLLLLLLIPAFSLWAQSDQETIVIYFGQDEFRPGPSETPKLDQLVLNLTVRSVRSISFTAQSDSKGTTDYNYKLCEKRARYTKDYLISKGMDLKSVQTHILGEVNASENFAKGANQRKVTLEVEYYPKALAEITTANPFPVISPEKSAPPLSPQAQLANISKTQTYSLPSDQDTFIIAESGTIFMFRANSFENFNGEPVTGELNIEIEEAYTSSDMLLKNLNTQSPDGLLESGGMISINVKSGEEELIIKESKPVSIAMPTKDLQDGMYPYLGEKDGDGNISWTLLDEQPMGVRENFFAEGSDLIPSIDVNGFGFRDIFGGGSFRFLFSKESRSQRKAQRKQKRDYQKRIMENGVSYREYRRQQRKATRVVNQERRDSYNPAAGVRRKINRYADAALDSLTTGEYNYYVFSTIRLGWVNCDRPIIIPADERVTFRTDLPYDKGTTCKVIFHRMPIIADPFRGTSVKGIRQRPKNIIFKGVKRDEPVTLIAIKYVDGIPKMAIKETVTTGGGCGYLHFKSYTPETMKAELEKLNQRRDMRRASRS